MEALGLTQQVGEVTDYRIQKAGSGTFEDACRDASLGPLKLYSAGLDRLFGQGTVHVQGTRVRMKPRTHI